MLREIRELGFEYTELSHGVRLVLVEGILEAVQAGEMKISSLHNFCPLPMGVSHAAPNLYKFTSEDVRERENALRHSLKTLNFAAQVHARVVVLHMGRVNTQDYTDQLSDLLEKGKGETDEYAALCEKAILERGLRRARAMELAGEMLEKLAAKAEELGITLGIENREELGEVPLEADFPTFLQGFDRPGVGYWHDTGHAQIKENLGFLNHATHFRTMSPRLVGMHIHDVLYPARDHSVPGTGTVKFETLKPWLKPGIVRVFELHPSLKPEEVTQGAAYVRKIWGDE